ncbi:MAG TPA: hypothetical protein K8W00_16910, partial [Kitasatospora aureofaciens]|nr:hypothetical protein [Kitasatospora aureofaciens]
MPSEEHRALRRADEGVRRVPFQERCYRQLRRVPAEESGKDPAAEDRELYLSLLRSRAVAGGSGSRGGGGGGGG